MLREARGTERERGRERDYRDAKNSPRGGGRQRLRITQIEVHVGLLLVLLTTSKAACRAAQHGAHRRKADRAQPAVAVDNVQPKRQERQRCKQYGSVRVMYALVQYGSTKGCMR